MTIASFAGEFFCHLIGGKTLRVLLPRRAEIDQASAEERAPTPNGAASAGPPGVKARKPRPRWVFDTSTAVSKNEAEAHGVLEEVRASNAWLAVV